MDAPFRLDFDMDSVLPRKVTDVPNDEDIQDGPMWVDLCRAGGFIVDRLHEFEYLKKKNTWYQFKDYETALDVAVAALEGSRYALCMGIYLSYGMQNIPIKVVEKMADGSLSVRDGTPNDTYRVMKMVLNPHKRVGRPKQGSSYGGTMDTAGSESKDDADGDPSARYWNIEKERT